MKLQPGFYYDMQFGEYLAIDAVNNSSFGAMSRSPMHYKHAIDNPRDPTPAMRFGALCHYGVLEPLKLAAQYAVMPPFEDRVRTADDKIPKSPKATTQYKELKAAWERENADKTPVLQFEYDKMVNLTRAVSARVGDFLDRSAKTEVSIVWEDRATKLLCKARLDIWRPELSIILDFKTARDANDFQWAIYNFCYHRQSAFYSDGVEALTGKRPEFWLVAAESEPPNGVRMAPVGLASIAAGRELYRTALDRIAHCRKTSKWPGYSDPDVWEIPESKMPSLDFATT